jgi:hypothetical protein
MTTLNDFTDTQRETPLHTAHQHDTVITDTLAELPPTYNGEPDAVETAEKHIETETTNTVIHTTNHGTHRIGNAHRELRDAWYMYETTPPYNVSGVLTMYSDGYFTDDENTETTLGIIPVTNTTETERADASTPYTVPVTDTDATIHHLPNPEFGSTLFENNTDSSDEVIREVEGFGSTLFENDVDTAITEIRNELFPDVDWTHNPDTGYGDWTEGVTTLMNIIRENDDIHIAPDAVSVPRVTHSLFRYPHSARHVIRGAQREYRDLGGDPRNATCIALGYALQHCADELTG